MSYMVAVSPRSSDEDEGTSDANDYLQDPSMWWDSLPHPFRLINDILQDLFEESWGEIEVRDKLEKERETNSRRIKCSEEATLMSCIPEATQLHYVKVDDQQLLFGSGLLGLYCIELKEPSKTLAGTTVDGVVSCISAEGLKGSKDTVIVGVGLSDGGGKVLALNGSQFSSVTEVSILLYISIYYQ